jgi:hypothetical protein
MISTRKDELETLYAALIIVCNMLGMRKLAERYKDDQMLGLNLLKFGNETIQNLETKRNGGMRNIKIDPLKQPINHNKGA